MQLSKAAELNKRKGFEHLVKCEMVTKRRQRETAREKEERERECWRAGTQHLKFH